jgi:hypothetical protein
MKRDGIGSDSFGGDGGLTNETKNATMRVMRGLAMLMLLAVGCGDVQPSGEDMTTAADMAITADLSERRDFANANDLAQRPDLWRPLDGGIREDGGICPSVPRCNTADDCCNGAAKCYAGKCYGGYLDPCNTDPNSGPVILCYSGGCYNNEFCP